MGGYRCEEMLRIPDFVLIKKEKRLKRDRSDVVQTLKNKNMEIFPEV